MAAAAAAKNIHTDEPVVGDAPKHELLQQRPATMKRKEGHSHGHGHGHGHGGGRNNTSGGGGGGSKGKSSSGGATASTSSGATGGGGGVERPAKQPKMNRPHTGASGGSQQQRQPMERASDDYCLERFKKNMKFSRSSKIKIA